MKLWGQLRWAANTRDLIVDIPSMIEIASAATTLYPGDIIAIGTPASVDRIDHGDTVTYEIDHVGRMELTSCNRPMAVTRYLPSRMLSLAPAKLFPMR